MSSVNKPDLLLVYLANGVQGGAVVREAVRRGYRVRALVRDKGKSRDLSNLGIELAQGDFNDPVSLRAANGGVAHAILQVPLGPLDAVRTLTANALSAAKAAGVRSIILKLSSASRAAPCDEPSFIANALIEDMVRASGLAFAIIRPTMYLDNLLKPGVRTEVACHGVFAVPIAASQRVAWTSAEDCAAAAITLLERGAYGGDHLISGPESVTGAQLVAAVSAGLGRTVVFNSEALETFEHDVEAAMGQGMGKRVGSKFRFFQKYAAEADAMLSPVFVPQPGLEGFCPGTIESWTRRHRDAFYAESPT